MKNLNIIICLLFSILYSVDINCAAICEEYITKTIKTEIIDQIKKLSERGINAQDHQGRTQLFLAAQYNLPEVIKDLMQDDDLDMDLADNDGVTPLNIAVMEKNIEAAQAILQNCQQLAFDDKVKAAKAMRPDIDARDKRIGYTPLMNAICSGNTKFVKILLDAGANPTVNYYREGKLLNLCEVTNYFDDDMTKILIPYSITFSDRTKVFRSLLWESTLRIDEIRKIVAMGFDINNCDNIYQNSPLHDAVYKNLPSIAKHLIKLGASAIKINRFGLNIFDLINSKESEILKDLLNDNKLIDEECVLRRVYLLGDDGISIHSGYHFLKPQRDLVAKEIVHLPKILANLVAEFFVGDQQYFQKYNLPQEDEIKINQFAKYILNLNRSTKVDNKIKQKITGIISQYALEDIDFYSKEALSADAQKQIQNIYKDFDSQIDKLMDTYKQKFWAPNILLNGKDEVKHRIFAEKLAIRLNCKFVEIDLDALLDFNNWHYYQVLLLNLRVEEISVVYVKNLSKYDRSKLLPSDNHQRTALVVFLQSIPNIMNDSILFVFSNMDTVDAAIKSRAEHEITV